MRHLPKESMRTTTRRAGVCALTSAVMVAALGVLQSQEAAPPDAFHGRADLVTLDVTVLDGDRRPIRGLTADDFVVLDGGEPRPVEAFSAVELPAPPPPVPAGSSSSIAQLASDVAANDPAAGRLVAILLDRSIPYGWPTLAARRIAHAAVDALGPGDRAAVIHTGVGRPQEFTNDRRALLAAIDGPGVGLTQAPPDTLEPASSDPMGLPQPDARVPEAPDPLTIEPDFETGRCQCGVCMLDAMTRIARAMEGASERQKLLLFIGRGVPFAAAAAHNDNCSVYVQPATHRMLDATRRAHLTVHAFDPTGLRPPVGTQAAKICLTGGDGHVFCFTRQDVPDVVETPDSLLALAAATGGRAALNSNEPEHELPAIFNETSAYYVVGFTPAPGGTPGSFRSVKISVRRRGAHVRTRSGYYVPGGAPDTSPAPQDPLIGAIRDLLPRTGVQLQLDPLPFPSASSGADISLVLRVTRDETALGRSDAAVDVLGAVYDDSGRAVASERRSVQVSGASDAFEETFTLHVPSPGSYQVRVAALDDGRTGSVYTFADVPDFHQAPVSLSGVGIHVDPPAPTDGTSTANERTASAALTTARTFDCTSQAAALAYVCQSTSATAAPVDVSGTVFDVTGRSVLRRTDTMAAASFAAGCASYQIGLPLDHLAPGEYLLTIDAVHAAARASRSVRFQVQ
jgi:VWFA-related protein